MQMVRAMRAIKDAGGRICVVLIDHTGLADTSRGRGSNAVTAAMDTEIRVTKELHGHTVAPLPPSQGRGDRPSHLMPSDSDTGLVRARSFTRDIRASNNDIRGRPVDRGIGMNDHDFVQQLNALADLRSSGAITEEEFMRAKGGTPCVAASPAITERTDRRAEDR